MNRKLVNSIKQFVIAVLTIVLALLVGAILVKVSGNDPVEAYTTLFRGAFGSKARISEVFVKMIPLSMMALGVSIAYKAQLWNIGANGQLTIGAILAILPGIYLGLPAVIMIPLSMLLAAVGGGLWCGLAAWLKNRFNANEVITTLMLNYIATYLLAFLVYGPMMDPDGGGFPQSKILPDAYHLPLFSSQMRIHAGIFVAVIVIVFMFFFWRTKLGVKIDLIGQGDKIATYSGVNVKRTVIAAMVLSGAINGLAGWNEVYGVQYRLLEGLSSGYGDIATIIALLGGLNPLGIVIASFFFSVLLVGGATMQRMTEVPYSIVDIIQGLVIVFVIARTAIHFRWPQKLLRKEKKDA
ncbi:MAG: ABC transporter permease [Coprococcus sp.]